MQHFQFENWKIGEFENSIFDVTNRLVGIIAGEDVTETEDGKATSAKACCKISG